MSLNLLHEKVTQEHVNLNLNKAIEFLKTTPIEVMEY
jgi:hypothetical protein